MDHKAQMRRLYELINAGDVDGFDEVLAADFVEHEEAPGLAPTREGAIEFFRMYIAREVFNGLRWIVRAGAQWRMMPNDLAPWYTVYQQARRWIAAGVFEDMVHDLRALIRLAKSKKEQPSAAIFDSRNVQSTPESGERAGYDGYKRKKGSKIHIAVDTLGLLLAAHVTPANEQERAQVKELAEAVQEATQQSVEVAFVDQGYTGDDPKNDAKEAGIDLIVVKLPEAKKGLVLLPDAGSSNAVLPGRHVSVAWHVISRDYLKRSEAFTFWLLPS